MNYINILIAFTLLILGIEAGEPAFASGNHGEGSWKIDQKRMWAGDCTIHLSPKSIRVDFPARSLGCYAQAPDWNVTFFNLKRKIYCIEKLSQFDGQMGPSIDIVTQAIFQDLKPAEVVPNQVLGMKAERIEFRAQDINKRWMQSHTEHIWLTPKAFAIEISAIKVNEQQSDMLHKIYKLPLAGHGFPCQFAYVSEGSGWAVALSTTKLEAEPFSANLYQVPKDFQLAHKSMDVTATKAGNAALDELLYSFDSDIKRSLNDEQK